MVELTSPVEPTKESSSFLTVVNYLGFFCLCVSFYMIAVVLCSFSWSVSQSVSLSVCLSVCLSVGQSVGWSVGQLVSWSVSLSLSLSFITNVINLLLLRKVLNFPWFYSRDLPIHHNSDECPYTPSIRNNKVKRRRQMFGLR